MKLHLGEEHKDENFHPGDVGLLIHGEVTKDEFLHLGEEHEDENLHLGEEHNR